MVLPSVGRDGEVARAPENKTNKYTPYNKGRVCEFQRSGRSEAYPLSATDLYQVLETSDLPAGVVNIVTATHSDVVDSLSGHMEVDALWYFGSDDHSASIERASVTNLKRTWVNNGLDRDWTDPKQGTGKVFLRQATEVKNIWIPYGE